jgi:dipeptidyl aminopeptidase/acylaminoacyl peptidase
MRFAAWSICLLTLPLAAELNSTFTVDDMLDVKTVSIAALSDDGQWLAATTSSLRDRIGIDNHRFGDPTYIAPAKTDLLVIDTRSGKSQKIFADRRQVRGLVWSPKATYLAMLALEGDLFRPVIWDRASGAVAPVKLPPGKIAADNADLRWSPDGTHLLLTLRHEEWRAEAARRFRQETEGPIVDHSSKEPFLAWDDLRRLSMERSLASCDWKAGGDCTETLPVRKLGSYDLTEDGAGVTYSEDITKKTDYDTISGAEYKVMNMPVSGGNAKTVLKSTKGLTLLWSRDSRHFAYTKDGAVWTASLDAPDPKQILGPKPNPADKDKKAEDETDAEKEKKTKERFSAVRLSPAGDHLAVSNKEGLWIADTATGTHELIVKMPEDDKLAPRYQVVDWSPDGNLLYLSYSSRRKWERGLCRYNVQSKNMEDLWKDGRIYSAFRMSKDGGTVVFEAAEGNHPNDLYVAAGAMKEPRRLTDLNPQLQPGQLGKTELITYLDSDGKKLNGVLYYPVGYETGKIYPTVLIVYEQFFDDVFNTFNSILTANGYAVLQPSVEFETGFPGEAWLKGATAAVNKVIEMGVADPDRLGLQGTSYGGYATNLLITQTNRFKAAVNISGKVDMVSFYTDSPRLGVRNIHAPEKSQDRIGATLWQQPQKYIQHSAIMFADRIKTPLLILNGEQDHNVPARQGMEMYYALRRLNREVEWVSYINGGHGMPTSTVEEVRDYTRRIVEWYDAHLKKPAPGAPAEAGPPLH